MKEERNAILRMLSEGKITVEEAETLLEVLGEDREDTAGQHRHAGRTWRTPRPPRPPKPPRPFRGMGRFVSGMEQFAQDLTESITGTFEDEFGAFAEEFDLFETQFDTSPQLISVAPGTTLEIRTTRGALTLFGTDEPDLKISGALRGHYRVREEDDVIKIKAKRFDTALTIHVPRTVERLIVKTHLGEVLARNFTEALLETKIQTHTGSIGFEIGALNTGKIWLSSHCGRIRLSLSDRSACNIQAVAKRTGEIKTDAALENVEQGHGYLKGTLNGGGADVRLATHTGTIFIKASASGEPAIVTPAPDSPPEDAAGEDETV